MGKEKDSLIRVDGSANHHLYKRGKVFWIRASKSGKSRLQKSLDTETLSTARLRRDEELAKYMGEKRLSNSHALLVEDKFPEFLETKSVKSPATQASMRNQWEKHLKEYFGDHLLEEVTETTWLKYVARKRKDEPARKFFNDRKYLSMFLHWLHREGLIQKLPKLPIVDGEIAEGKVFSKEMMQSLLVRAPEDLKLQIILAYTMGMRIGEIMSLEWNQVDLTKKTIYLPASKTKIRKERTFGISEAAFSILKERKDKALGAAVFHAPGDYDKVQGRQGNKRVWASCKRAAGIPSEYRFHWLRHTFLTNAFKASINPALICEFAGLSLEEAQKTYLHFTVEDTRVVAKIVEVYL